MVRSGYPQRQAVAASLSNAQRHPRANGGAAPILPRGVGFPNPAPLGPGWGTPAPRDTNSMDTLRKAGDVSQPIYKAKGGAVDRAMRVVRRADGGDVDEHPMQTPHQQRASIRAALGQDLTPEQMQTAGNGIMQADIRAAKNPQASGYTPRDLGEEDRASGGHVTRALRTVSDVHRRHLAFAGVVSPFSRQNIYAEEAPIQGFLGGDTLGRADAKNASVTSGAYVMPADVISGLGMGNSLAGAALTQKWLTTGPFGMPEPRGGRGSGPPRPPSGLRTPEPPYAKGGGAPIAKGAQDPVPVALSDGEFVIKPEIVAHHADLGGLPLDDHDPKHYEAALKRGHDILDHLVLALRAKHLKETAALPKPAK